MILNLNTKTLQVLAVLLTHYDNLDSSISYELKNRILFSPSYKKTLRESILDEEGKIMNENNFNNYIQLLKNSNLIIGKYGEAMLVKWIIISPSVNKSITFQWDYKDGQQNKQLSV